MAHCTLQLAVWLLAGLATCVCDQHGDQWPVSYKDHFDYLLRLYRSGHGTKDINRAELAQYEDAFRQLTGQGRHQAIRKLARGDASQSADALASIGRLMGPEATTQLGPPTLSQACINATGEILPALENGSPWAVQMFDSWSKIESGILVGNTLWPGSFSECLNVSVPALHHPFNGMHCVISIANMTAPAPLLPGLYSLGMTFGVCLPDACNLIDTYILAYEALHFLGPEGPLPADIGPVSSVCHSSQTPPLDSPAIGIISFLSVLVFILLAATLYDILVVQRACSPPEAKPSDEDEADEDFTPEVPIGVYSTIEPPRENVTLTYAEGHRGWFPMLMVRLSLYSNAAKLLSTERTKGSLDAVHGLRFFSMTWVMLGHTYLFIVTVTSNVFEFYPVVQNFAFQAISNAFVSVDTFFLLSGCLTSYLLLKELSQRGGPRHVNWALFYFHRFWRLTPPYMIVLGAHTALFKYLGNGPFWPSTGMEPDCPNSWWANLLYVNNLIDKHSQCMGWAWYLANDMQFFIVSPIFILALYWNKYVGIVLSSVGILTSVLSLAIQTGLHNCGPGILIGAIYPECGSLNSQLYYRPWYRWQPYIVGILLGYVLLKAGKNLRLKWYIRCLGWLVAAGGALAIVYGLHGVMNGHPFTAAGDATYRGLHSTVWALAVSWVIFACVTGNGGPVNAFLSWRALIPLSRLTYMAYLIHPIVMVWYNSTREVRIVFSHSEMVWMFLGFLCVTYAFSFLFSLAFEAPMLGLEKVIFKKKRD